MGGPFDAWPDPGGAVGPAGPEGPAGPAGPAGPGALFAYQRAGLGMAVDATVRYLTDGTALNTTLALAEMRVPRAATLKGIAALGSTVNAPGFRVAVLVNGVTSALLVDVTATGAWFADDATELILAAGDLVVVAAWRLGSGQQVLESVVIGSA